MKNIFCNYFLPVLSLFFLTLMSCSDEKGIVIYHTNDAYESELLSAKELQRYLYVCTGRLPKIEVIGDIEISGNSIVVGTAEHLQSTVFGKTLATLANDEYQLKSTANAQLVIAGGNDAATLYGAYKFLESTGIGFALHGDIIPDEKLKDINLVNFDKVYKPSFALRGIQPFHDFPEGPDWWNEDDYEMIITQLPKLGMNFIGFHTYPEKKPFGGWEKAEPQVWIGTKEMFNADGTIKVAYPVLNSNTGDSTWAYYPKKTSEFSFGASMIFESDVYGTDFMRDTTPWPHRNEENVNIFNSMGSILNHSFTLANRLGVKTCVGTEIPVTIPSAIKQNLREQGKDPDTEASRLAVYEGIFSRIKATHPLDYYWFWTPEGWTWEGENTLAVERTEKDFKLAIEAKKNVGADFTLATCGWVLGPARDRAEFDQMLPKEMPFGVINRDIGFTPVEPAFKNISGRPKWQISWIEDDNALTTPQFWAGRVMRDAFDANAYGCTGMMGIHWRTINLSPAFMALAKSGWEASSYESPGDSVRHFNAEALYNEWAVQQFGKDAAEAIAPIFSKLDGGIYEYGKGGRHAYLPRASEWGQKGGGTIKINQTPWLEVEKDYAFVSTLEQQRERVKGTGNIARYEYWLSSFKYARIQAKVGCILGQMQKAAYQLEHEKDKVKQKVFAEQILVSRREAINTWDELISLLLETVNSTGEMGTLANYEQQNLESLKQLTRYDKQISEVTGQPVPALDFRKSYDGKSRLIVTTQRSLLSKGEPLTTKIRVLSANPVESVVFNWKPLGGKDYQTKVIKAEARNVFAIVLEPSEFNFSDFEYNIVVKTGNDVLHYPVNTDHNQTVIVW